MPCTTHQTNMNEEEGNYNFDPQLDGNDNDILLDLAEDFVYQYLINNIVLLCPADWPDAS